MGGAKMGIASFLEKLEASLRLNWRNTTGDNANKAKIKTRGNSRYIAGRDINNTTINNQAINIKPYVLLSGGFGGNGIQMHFYRTVHNLSDEPIFLDTIELLGRVIDCSGSPLLAQQKNQGGTVEDFTYPVKNDAQYAIVYFHTRSGKKYTTKQQITFVERADGKYDPVLDTKSPVIEEV